MVIDRNSNLKRNIYLLASIALKKLNKIDDAINMVNHF